MRKKRRLLDEYRLPGCRPRASVQGKFGDPKARIIVLERRQKKRYADVVERFTEAITTGKSGECGTCRAETRGYIWRWKYDGYCAGGAER